MSQVPAPLALPGEAEKLLNQFDKAWRGPAPPRIEDYLTVAGASTRPALLEELIKIDLEYRWRQRPTGCQPLTLGDYVLRFPELGPLDRISLELIGEEYRARHLWGDRPSGTEYLKRFMRHGASLGELLSRIEREVAADRDSQKVRPTGGARSSGAAVPPQRPNREEQAIDSTATLVAVLRQCQLLAAKQLEQLFQELQGRSESPRAVAKELLQRGWLTAYQVNQLFQGHGRELALGPYLILERLGEGGSGQVFKARHQRMDRVVALKVIRRELLAEAHAVRRFYREIEVVSRLEHPNVVHAYDAGPIGSTHVLAMEYVDGIDLGRLVKQHGPLPAAQACDYMRQAALGLQHAHERRLVHRDIKPSNLLVTPKPGPQETRPGVIKILDLGLARLRPSSNEEATLPVDGHTMGTLTPQGTVMVMGTPDFLAPEQAIDFHAADIRADIYSLGCTFYYLLAGQPPFAGGTLAQKLLKHQQGDAPGVEQLRKDVPVGLDLLLRKMLAKRPEDRYRTPAEVAAALAGLMRQFPTAMDGLSAPRRRMPHLSRRGLAWASLAGGLLALCLLFFFISSVPPPAILPVHEVGKRSPLDILENKQIPSSERFAWQSKDLVAVLGEHRWLHWGVVRTVVVTPDGKLLVTAGDDAIVRVWNVMTRQLTRTLVGHTAAVRGAAIDRSGQNLATASEDGSVRLWDLNTGRLRNSFQGHEGEKLLGIAFSPDGTKLATAGADKTVRLWIVAADQTPPGKPTIHKGHEREVLAVVFAPDGETLASGSSDSTVRFWDVAKGQQRGIALKCNGPVPSLAFSPNGQLLATAEGGELADNVKVWDVGSRKVLFACKHHYAHAVAFAPDSKTIASGGGEQRVRLWDVASGKERTEAIQLISQALAVAFADSQTLIAGAEDGSVRLWDTGRGGEASIFSGEKSTILGIALTPDGRTVITGEGATSLLNRAGQVRLWDVASGLPTTLPPEHKMAVFTVACAPDGLSMVSGGSKGEAILWDLATTKVRARLRGHDNPVRGIAYSPDARTVATVDGNYQKEGKVIVWDVATGAERGRVSRTPGFYSVAFSPDGNLLATGPHDGSIPIWEAGGLTQRNALQRGTAPGSASSVAALAFAPDGRFLATGGAPSLFRLWSLEKGREQFTCPLRATATKGLVFTPDGRSLFAVAATAETRLQAGTRGQVVAWDLAGQRLLKEWPLPGPVNSGVLAADGRHFATANANGTVYIFRPFPVPSPQTK